MAITLLWPYLTQTASETERMSIRSSSWLLMTIIKIISTKLENSYLIRELSKFLVILPVVNAADCRACVHRQFQVANPSDISTLINRPRQQIDFAPNSQESYVWWGRAVSFNIGTLILIYTHVFPDHNPGHSCHYCCQNQCDRSLFVFDMEE